MVQRLLVALGLMIAGLMPAAAQSYPARAVRVIVPFGPGGPADIYARAVAQHLSDVMKQAFVIENRAGAGATIGTREVQRSPADGYTLLMMSNTHTANETLLPNRGYELMRDFVPIAPVNASDLVFVVHPSVEAKTLPELIALAKARPGTLNYASSGLGTPYHLAGENFKAITGTDIVHLPHRNSGDARNAVLGGHAQLMIDAVSTMLPTIQSGNVRALATSGRTRNAVTPDVPTAIEMGVANYEATIWLGFMAPAGTPKAIVDQLNAEIRRFQERPEIKSAWGRLGVDVLAQSPEEFGQFLRDDIAKWGAVIRAGNIRAE
ncbi:MAG: tripartite tricarboxylate transporter substrate binding protein [Alphaproteobacteria bacterium]